MSRPGGLVVRYPLKSQGFICHFLEMARPRKRENMEILKIPREIIRWIGLFPQLVLVTSLVVSSLGYQMNQILF